jgi:hypothetical protein
VETEAERVLEGETEETELLTAWLVLLEEETEAEALEFMDVMAVSDADELSEETEEAEEAVEVVEADEEELGKTVPPQPAKRERADKDIKTRCRYFILNNSIIHFSHRCLF